MSDLAVIAINKIEALESKVNKLEALIEILIRYNGILDQHEINKLKERALND